MSHDCGQSIHEQVKQAIGERHALSIHGAGSHAFMPGEFAEAQRIDMTAHRGIIDYQPSELTLKARAGTPIDEINRTLTEQGQRLATEVPVFGEGATLGGALATGLTGSGRPFLGAVRDHVLGARLVNGHGEIIDCGGQVMKNVAGYDVSRLVAGAWGALGVILEVSMRVAPQWQTQQTLCFSMAAPEAVQFCRDIARRYLPISGTWWADDRLYLRLSGTHAAVQSAVDELGGEKDLNAASSEAFWDAVRDHAHAFFKPRLEQQESADVKLWRIVVPPGAPVPRAEPGVLAIEWGGGLRWWWHADADEVHRYAREHRGWAWALGEPVALDAAQRKLMSNIKAAFDPDGVLHSPLHLQGGAP